MERGRVLALDPGSRRVGVAVSDETGLLARPLAVIARGPSQSVRSVADAVAAIVQREGVARIVVGLPLNADGSQGTAARSARGLARALSHASPVPVELWDERLSTVEAERLVREQGRSARRVRARADLDAVAATVILQDFLDSHATRTRLVDGSDLR